jgi:succinoglycan biosynthesis transport protein ExoP
MMTKYQTETGKSLIEQFRHYWRVIFKWKWIALIFVVLAVTGATLFSLLSTPIFTASGSLWVEDEPNILPFEQIQALSAGSDMNSYIFLLQSQTLAAETINKLKLFENPEFVGNPSERNGSIDPSSRIFRERLIKSFIKSIAVAPIPGTRLVEVRFSHRNPMFAAETLNALFDGFIEMIVKKRYAASEQAKESLNIPIAALRTEIAEREKQLNEYGMKKNILPLTAAEAPTLAKLTEYNKALTDAALDRINKYNFYNQVKSAPLGEIRDTPAGSLIPTLRAQYSTLNREYSKRLVALKPEYPEMQSLKSELDAAAEALQNETQNLIRAALTDYQAALGKEQSLQKILEDLKKEAYATNSDAVFYNGLRIELESKKTLLETLTKRQSETEVSSRLKGLEPMNVWIMDKADPPLAPTFPKKRKIVLLGLLIGLAGGLGLTLGLEYMNQTIKTSKDVTISTGLPTLGSIPSFDAETKSKGPGSEFKRLINTIRGGEGDKERKKKAARREKNLDLMLKTPLPQDNAGPKRNRYIIELIASRMPQSIQSESYRSIRTTLLVSSPPKKIKSILFTSPLAGEGKSTTISNLGATLAAAHLRVVIVDSDLRKPTQHRIFGQEGGTGLTRFLSSDGDPMDLVMPTQIPNLCLIKSGPLPANPIELLASEKMNNLVLNLRKNFDYVLFDTPPILAVSDAIAMSPLADTIILVCRGGHTPLQAMKQAKQKLDTHNLHCLGVIINGVNLVEQDGYYARQYYSYSPKSG